MKNLKVLDVTLRDGGCINDFNFGQSYMEKILDAQEKSNIDIIELGYIDEKKGSTSGRTQYLDETVIPKIILKNKKSNTSYVAMIDYGKFNIDNLHEKSESSIDGIRLAFHKKDSKEVIKIGRKIISKGYKFYIQPMITLRYSDSELLDLINLVNNELSDAEAFYIVDSFGEMRPNDMSRVLNLIDHNLIPSMAIGFHSHNNLQLAYSNAMTMLQFPTNREIIIDSSIMGMGKGAGNLNTELLLEHLNIYYGKSYNISPLLEVIDTVINQLHNKYYWGYAPEYYLSSANHCTPSYASHFYNKHMLSIDKVGELLKKIPEEKKISFDKEFADKLYYSSNSNEINDSAAIEKLKSIFNGKEILLIAPGKSINSNKEKINELISNENVISIAINSVPFCDVDYYFVSKKTSLENLKFRSNKIITTSNVSLNDEFFVLNYSSWINTSNGKSDAAIIMIGNLLKSVGVTKLYLAGFDGFKIESNMNYYDESLYRPMNSQKVEERNHRTEDYLNSLSKYMKIDFITPTIYKIN